MTAPIATTAAPPALDRYAGYSYAYPHKTAYRRFDPPIPLGELWSRRTDDRPVPLRARAVLRVRCGFCNLFTQHRPPEGHGTAFLGALEREVEAVTGEIGTGGFARIAVGGGTPTLLTAAELDRLFC